MTSEFFPEESQKKLDRLLQGIGTFVANANDIIGDPNNKANIKGSLAHFSDATNNAAIAMEDARKLMDQMSRTLDEFKTLAVTGTGSLKNTDLQMERLVAAIVNTSSELGRAMTELRTALEKANQGQGTVGHLVNDAKLYENLLESTDQLNRLLKDLQDSDQQGQREGTSFGLLTCLVSLEAILDCYTDEPAGLGVPPFIGVWPRYVAGRREEEPTYLTIDDLRLIRYVQFVRQVIIDPARGRTHIEVLNRTRNAEESRRVLESLERLVIVAGVQTPGKYLSARPGTLREVHKLLAEFKVPTLLTGPVLTGGTQFRGGSVPQVAQAEDFNELQPFAFDSYDELQPWALRGLAHPAHAASGQSHRRN